MSRNANRKGWTSGLSVAALLAQQLLIRLKALRRPWRPRTTRRLGAGGGTGVPPLWSKGAQLSRATLVLRGSFAGNTDLSVWDLTIVFNIKYLRFMLHPVGRHVRRCVFLLGHRAAQKAMEQIR